MLAVILCRMFCLPKSVKIKTYRTIILPVVLYGCETWSLTVREECRLRVFENRVLRKIFGPKKDEVTGEWRSYMLCTIPDDILVIKSRRLRWEKHEARMGTSTGAYWVLVVKPEGRRQPERPRSRWEDNIKMDLTEVEWGINWIGTGGGLL